MSEPNFTCVLPSGDVMVTDEGHGLLHCAPDFSSCDCITHHGETLFDHPTSMACVGGIFYVYDQWLEQLFSFASADLAPLRATRQIRTPHEAIILDELPTSHYTEVFAVAGDRLLIVERESQNGFREPSCIKELDGGTLAERRTFLAQSSTSVDLSSISAMAVLGNQLFVSTRDRSPLGLIHVFSLQGRHERTAHFTLLGNCNVLVSAHGRLYATEFGEVEEGMDADEQFLGLRSHFGRRVVVLSRHLDVVHVFRIQREAADLFGITPRGNRLLITDYDHHLIHEVSTGPR